MDTATVAIPMQHGVCEEAEGPACRDGYTERERLEVQGWRIEALRQIGQHAATGKLVMDPQAFGALVEALAEGIGNDHDARYPVLRASI